MTSINQLTELLDILFDEKDNFSNENTYLTICDLIKKIGSSINTDTYYAELLNEQENSNFLRQSRKSYMKELTRLAKKCQSLEFQVKKKGDINIT